MSRFHGKCGGAGLLSISQQFLPILEGIRVDQEAAGFITGLNIDKK